MKQACKTAFALTLVAVTTFFTLSVSQADERKPSAPNVTFTKDVAPIFFKSCVECHRPGESAPFSALTYNDVRPWATSIREKVIAREMPPWHADPQIGYFKNDRRLTEGEINTITAWVDGGSKEGDRKDLPAVPEFLDGWTIGKPDLIIPMSEEFTLEASGPDEYQYFEVDPGFTKDKYVQMAEARPGNRRIVHHINVFIQPPPDGAHQKKLTREELESLRFQQEKDSILYLEGFLRRLRPGVPVYDDGCELPSGGGGTRLDGSGQREFGTWLGGFVPGTSALAWGPGAVKKIPAGSKLIINVHYSKTTGKVKKDRSIVGLVFARQTPRKQILTRLIANHYFQIPPGAENHRVTACWTASEDIHLVSAAPHMHFRGKAMDVRAIYADGRRETLLNVPRYSFSWQTMYQFKEPIAIPKGTRLVVTGYFDNSVKNRYNPAPTRSVRWGDPTYDEMMMSLLEYSVDNGPTKPVARNTQPRQQR